MNRETPGKESFSGQFYPEQSVFHGFIGHPEGSSDVNATRSNWMVANSNFLNITFQSDDVFNNFGTSLTFKCSNSSHLNATENLGFDAEMLKQKTNENTVALIPKKLEKNSLIENEIMESNGTGDCHFIKLEENLIAAFIDAEIFEIKIKLKNRIERENIFLHFGNTKTIEGRAHQTSSFREISLCERTGFHEPFEVSLNEEENEIAISYRQYKISEIDFGNFLRVKKNTESIYFGSIILPRVFTLIASGKMSKFKSIEVDVNPENEFNIKSFKDTIQVQEW